jgi:hypothetical protein
MKKKTKLKKMKLKPKIKKNNKLLCQTYLSNKSTLIKHHNILISLLEY